MEKIFNIPRWLFMACIVALVVAILNIAVITQYFCAIVLLPMGYYAVYEFRKG